MDHELRTYLEEKLSGLATKDDLSGLARKDELHEGFRVIGEHFDRLTGVVYGIAEAVGASWSPSINRRGMGGHGNGRALRSLKT
jgi:hypothetical protein